jgi:hypothetical protein
VIWIARAPAPAHVTWVDKETYLPLKMEAYTRDGNLQHRYEVTSIEYDVSIPDSVFKDVPPRGTEIVELPFPKLPPDGKPEGATHEEVSSSVSAPGVRVSAPPTR